MAKAAWRRWSDRLDTACPELRVRSGDAGVFVGTEPWMPGAARIRRACWWHVRGFGWRSGAADRPPRAHRRPGSGSRPGHVLAGVGLDLDAVADVHEQRHHDLSSCFHRRGLVAAATDRVTADTRV